MLLWVAVFELNCQFCSLLGCEFIGDDPLAIVNHKKEMLHYVGVLRQKVPSLAIDDDSKVVFFLRL